MVIRHLKNENGLTLMELLIVAAVTSVLVVGLTSFMFLRSQQQKNSERQQSVAQVVNNTILAASTKEAINSSQEMEFATQVTIPPQRGDVVEVQGIQVEVPDWAYNQVNSKSNDYYEWLLSLSNHSENVGLVADMNRVDRYVADTADQTTQSNSSPTPSCTTDPSYRTSIDTNTTKCTRIGNVSCDFGRGNKLLWDDQNCTWKCVPDCSIN